MLKIGVMGGTFNPIHYGHLAAAEEIRDRLRLDRVLFIPSNLPPHKQEEGMPAPDHRLEMVRQAVLPNPRFDVSDMEIRRGGRSYTIDTVIGLQQTYPGVDMYFITGLDSFLDIQTWREWKRLLSLCWFVVLSRPGYRFSDLGRLGFMHGSERDLLSLDRGVINHLDVRREGIAVCLDRIPLYDISSTDIRRRIREGRTVKYLLPDPVETYIIEHKLYA